MTWDVACLGELVVDMVPRSLSGGEWLYAPSPGGAPGNVASGLARLGRKSVMLGKVGDEAFGQLIVAALHKHGVDISGVSLVPQGKTRLSVVTLAADGERDFMFYCDNPADSLFEPDDVPSAMIEGSRMLHVGVLLMAASSSASAQTRAIALAHAAGKPVALDPNFRTNLWPDRDSMLWAGRMAVSQASIVKLGVDELLALTGEHPVEDAVRSLWHSRMKVMAVTHGSKGAEIYTPDGKLICKGYAINAVDTTGAGDAFMASLMSGLLQSGLDAGADQMLGILRASCAAGALATTRKGAMESMPTAEEIARLLATQPENGN